MLRRGALFAAVVALAVYGASNVSASEQPATAYPSQRVLKDIVIWLSTNFDLPRILINPNIEIIPLRSPLPYGPRSELATRS